MTRLMKLEIQKHSVGMYIQASAIITILMIGLIYLFAYVPQFDPNDPDLFIFEGYNNVIKLYGVVNMTIFCVFACVIYSRIIIEAYKGKQLILLFSYPINHKKILISKIATVTLFISVSMIVSNIIVFSTFFTTESISPIIVEPLSDTFILNALKTTSTMVVSTVSLSIIATGIGFYTKSVPTTIITGIILSSLLCNVVFNSLDNELGLLIFMIISFIAGIIVTTLLMDKVNKLEVL